MKVIFGLGNPGSKYSDTRHNIGYMLLDYIAGFFSVNFSKANKDYSVANLNRKSEKVFLVKPVTFMNLSGLAVKNIINFYKLDYSDILVVCDDINLDFGQLRIKEKGGDGGHNGLSSIIYEINNSDFARLRIGVGNSFQKGQQSDFVLSPFSNDERKELKSILDFAKDISVNFLECGIKSALDFYSKKMKEKKDLTSLIKNLPVKPEL